MPSSRFDAVPHVDHVTQDGFLTLVKDRPPTDRVLIIGPAVDGPVDRVVSLNSVGDIERTFGPVVFNSSYVGPNGETTGYNENALMKALREVQSGGAGDIRLLRVGGSFGTGTFTMEATLNVGATGTITATAEFAGRLYNQVIVTFTSGAVAGQVAITQPAIKGGTLTLTWTGANSGLTIAQMIDRVNSDPRNKTVELAIGSISGSAPARVLHGSFQLTGGTDGTRADDLATNKVTYYDALTHATTGVFNDFLNDYEADVVYLSGIYLDDLVVSGSSTVSVAQAFTDFLGRRSIDHPMFGVIGTRPAADYKTRAQISDHVTQLINPVNGTRNNDSTWITAGYFMNAGFPYSDSGLEQRIDAGQYLQVVAAEVLFNDSQLGVYRETAAGLYAGHIAALRPQESMTFKPVRGVFGLPYKLTRAQLQSLNEGVGRDLSEEVPGRSAYVTIHPVEGKGLRWTNDVTASARDSDFADLYIARLVASTHKAIKIIAFDFLGKPNDLAHRMALETEIKSLLDSMADSGALLGKENVGYMLELNGGRDPISQGLGLIDIDLTLVPNRTIKAVRVRIRVTN